MKKRRTKQDIQAIEDAIVEVLTDEHPMTIRQVFYRLVAGYPGLIEKTQKEYKTTVCRLMKRLRENGTIPYLWIVDASRHWFQATVWDSLEEALQVTRDAYRRSLWNTMDRRVEIWVEAEGIINLISSVTDTWGVPTFPAKGYSSLTVEFLAAERMTGWFESRDKPTTIYYFGDHDPSGVDISRVLEWKIRKHLIAIREFITFAEVDDNDRLEIIEDTQHMFAFERVAVLPWQIKAWDLPGRPPKKSDSRAKNFQGESVELETIKPSQLREMVGECIEQHVDQRKLEMTKRIEKLERATLQKMMDSLNGNGAAV